MRDLMQDVRYGLAAMARKPLFTLIVVSALALGIGANTAIFSVVNAVLLRPLPYPDPDRLVRLHDAKPPELVDFPVSAGNFRYWQQQTRSFEHLAAHFGGRPLILTGAGQPEQLDVARVSATLFPLLGASPILGRGFAAAEETRGRDQVVILSYAMWQRRFGGAVIGQSLTLSDKPYTIIGVMPESFRYPADSTQAWVPLGWTARDEVRHGSHYLTVLGRLKRGTSIDQAQAEMNAIAHRLALQNPETNAGWRTDVVSWKETLVGTMRRPLLILTGAVLFVLLIACMNVTNLLLARGTSRSREVAIRMALGASRARVARQLLTESLLLSLIGGALGLILAIGAVKTLSVMAPAAQNASIDPRVLAFTFGVSMLAGMLFGLAPVLQLTRSDVSSAMKDGARGTTAGARHQRVQKALVVVEIGLSLLLLIGAVLLIRSFANLRGVDAGFDPTNVLTMSIQLPNTRYKEDPQQAAYFQRVLDELATLPGVQSAAAVAPLPFGDSTNYGFTFDGQPEVPADQRPSAHHFLISPRYFELMGVPVLQGRAFNDRDRADTPRVAIINDTMARRYFPNESPIGKRLFITSGSEEWREIVGVVADVKAFDLETEPSPQMYEVYSQEPAYAMTIAVRTQTPPAGMTDAIVQRIMSIDKDQPVTNVRTMESIVAASLERRRFSMTLLSLFAAVALVLAATGIYGVMSYAVSLRTHEIGIRMSLGAQAADVFRLVVGEGARLAALGVILGLGAAFALMPVMRSLLYGVSATDVQTFAAVAIALAAVAILASYIPARKAMRVDLLVALRQE